MSKMQFDRAFKLYKEGDREGCIEEFEKGLRSNYDQRKLMFEAVYDCQVELHDYEKAIRTVDSMIKLDDTCTDYYTKRASLHIIMNNYRNAKDDVDKALTLDPENLKALTLNDMVGQSRLSYKSGTELKINPELETTIFTQVWFGRVKDLFGWRKSGLKLSELWDDASSNTWLISCIFASFVCYWIGTLFLYQSPENPKGQPVYPRDKVVTFGSLIFFSLVIIMWLIKNIQVKGRYIVMFIRILTRGLLPAFGAIAGTFIGSFWQRFLGFSFYILAATFLLIGFEIDEDMGAMDMVSCLCVASLIPYFLEHCILGFIAFWAIFMFSALKITIPGFRASIYAFFIWSSGPVMRLYQRVKDPLKDLVVWSSETILGSYQRNKERLNGLRVWLCGWCQRVRDAVIALVLRLSGVFMRSLQRRGRENAQVPRDHQV